MKYAIIASCHTDNGGWALTIKEFSTDNEIEARQALQATQWAEADAPAEAWNQTLTLKGENGRTIGQRRVGDAGNTRAIAAVAERRGYLGKVAAQASPETRAWAVAATCYAALKHFLGYVESEGGAMGAEITGRQLVEQMVKEIGLDKAIEYDAFIVLDWAERKFYGGNYVIKRELRTICGREF